LADNNFKLAQIKRLAKKGDVFRNLKMMFPYKGNAEKFAF